jgi:type I restriction enzyme S subunit
MKAWQGSCGVSLYDGIVSPAYFVFDLRIDNPTFFNYAIRSRHFVNEFGRISKGIRVGQWDLELEQLKYVYFSVPPRDEQDQIVLFLDWKVSLINKLINAKRRQIELLREKKQAVINTAVTIYNDGWEVKPLKYWAKSNLQSLAANVNPNLEIEYLDISAIGHGFVKRKPVKYLFADAPSRARRVVKYGDTIISNVRTYLRSVCFIDHETKHCIVSTGFSVLTPDESKVMPEMLSFVLASDAFIDEVIRNSIGVSYPAINDKKLMSLKIGLPRSLEAQIKMYESLKNSFIAFDDLIKKLKNEIDIIIEYRTRLISDVVTGKLDVRGVAVPEYETVDDTTMDNNDEETEDI